MAVPDNSNPSPIEGIDFSKLLILIRKYSVVLIALFTIPIFAAYLYLRYTKNLYESESELRLEVKKQTELALLPQVEDKPGNELSGEIEQIRSKVFLAKVADSLPLKISYYYVGKLLDNELYKQSPFQVTILQAHKTFYNTDWFVQLSHQGGYILLVGKSPIRFSFGKPVSVGNATIRFHKTEFLPEADDVMYYFTIHSEDRVLDYLRRNLKVEPINLEASTIRISFQDFNARKAYDIVNTIDSLYLLFSNEQKSLATRQKIIWLNNELRQIEMKMEDYENYFEQFMLSNRSSSASEEINRIITSLYKIDSQRYQTQQKLRDIEVLQKSLTTGESPRPKNSSVELPKVLTDLLREQQLLTEQKSIISLSYNPNTLTYKQIDQRHQAVTRELDNQLADLRLAFQRSIQELSKRKKELEDRFSKLPNKNTEFTKNQRFYKLYEEFYLSMMQSRAGIEITQAGTLPNFAILSAATLPSEPVSPKRLLTYGIGLTAGLLLGFFFLGTAYLLHNRITSLSEVEKNTPVPVLGVIPQSGKSTVELLQVIHQPKSRVSEAIRILRTNLDFFIEGKKNVVICITSTIGGEGKSFVASNLAALFALAQKKVVLVDLDMRKAKNPLFPSSIPEIGISTVLIRKYALHESIVNTSYPNLAFIPAGPIPPNPAELLVTGEFSSVLETLKADYDLIILDTPPSGLVTDAIMVMKKSDISIYIVRANYSKREFLQHINRLKQLHQFTKFSIVLNALPIRTKGYGYYAEKG